ncbi:GNAT family N-acetyltransferase [Paenibacillus sp. NEAU-GSW1]|uniref:GNAT family N-acetyltransferase n=1 Tax=Paenibacillus sp. NEAU-GSW1 TaxID=2682486 RepID=UPI00139CBFF9|nr:GNAT family N-acetyltransferase [Paenibacillus sp. NEAU-GSW1]
MTSRKITNNEDREAAFRIRTKVFVEEQGVPAENEYDQYDEPDTDADHVLVLYNGLPAATGRVRNVGGTAKLERICVLASHRKYGLGKITVEALETFAKLNGLAKAKLNSQTQAEPFYAKLGYRAISDIFMEENIPHVTMAKELSQ